MSTIDINSVAGFKAVDAEGNELGIMSMADITAAVKESIMQDAAMARSVATLSEASTLAASDTYEDELDIKTDLTWARALDANGNPILISKESLASVVGGLLNVDGVRNDFNGNFSDFKKWDIPGVYRYNINTESSGSIDGPNGTSIVYGLLEVMVRSKTKELGLNVVVQKFYSHIGSMKMRICTRTSSDPVDTWKSGEWKQMY